MSDEGTNGTTKGSGKAGRTVSTSKALLPAFTVKQAKNKKREGRGSGSRFVVRTRATREEAV